MNVSEAIFKRRSIRRFSPQPVDKEVLYELVQAARMAPAAANIQPLQYMIVHQKQLLDPVFDCTLWAGYLEDYAPKQGFRPTAYIVVLVNEDIKKAGNDNDFLVVKLLHKHGHNKGCAEHTYDCADLENGFNKADTCLNIAGSGVFGADIEGITCNVNSCSLNKVSAA